jgi:hypothetical protein
MRQIWVELPRPADRRLSLYRRAKGKTLLKRLLPVLLLSAGLPAAAAELSGIAMPDAETAAGAHLTLNGMALRTYSILGIHIYVAGLYLDHRSADPEAIMNSKTPKLLRFVFLRDVDAETSRKSWRESLDDSCRLPCRLPPAEVEQFIADVPAVRKGDVANFVFTATTVDFFVNGRSQGHMDDPLFTRVILSTFIGGHPSANEVKRGLLGAPA